MRSLKDILNEFKEGYVEQIPLLHSWFHKDEIIPSFKNTLYLIFAMVALYIIIDLRLWRIFKVA